jgi:hypothetical protein
MRHRNLIALAFLGTAAFAQQVHFDYDRSANFGAYKTYQWVDRLPVAPGDQLLDMDIKRAADEQLAGKGLRRVDSGGDLQVSYQGAVTQEKEFDSIGFGPGWWGDRRITSSTVETGNLIVEIVDPAAGHLVWRGSASKTLDIKEDPDRNYRTLQKVMAKLFQNWPPGSGRH